MDLAVGASSDAVTSLVGKLGSVLTQQIGLVRGVREDIRYINDEMASMQAFLTAGRRVSNHDEQRRVWMKQVRDMVYDIEDINHRLGPAPRGNGKLMFLRKAWYVLTTLNERRCVATEIRMLKRWAKEISDRRMRYGVEMNLEATADAGEHDSSSTFQGYCIAAARSKAPDFIGKPPVGIEKDIELIQDLIQFDSEQSAESGPGYVVAICGPGGSGKTIFATELYRKIGDEFDCRASVHASEFNLLMLLRTLVKQLSASQIADVDGIEEWGEKRLEDELVDQPKGKRYLILIDDICTVPAWRTIHNSLPVSMNGIVLVTTRSSSVAAACCRNNGYLHEQNPLNVAKSWNMFRQCVDYDTEDPTDARPCMDYDIEDSTHARQLISARTGGLPLAIIILAGLVASRRGSCTDREKSLGEHMPGVNRILGGSVHYRMANLLDECYNDLPGELKTCLLYFIVFPKGCFISRKRLIRKWVAEGFLSEGHGNTPEDVAEACFNQLIVRKIIRPVSISRNGKVKNCQIHDIVHEYLVSKSSQENFITVVGGCFEKIDPEVLSMYKVRCLSVHTSPREEKKTLEMMKLKNVRSLTAFNSFKVLRSSLPKFQILQVLDLECCRDVLPSHVNKICKMHQLKYLSLRGTDIVEIPSDIGIMVHLELLDIRETQVRTLPPSVKWLKRMAHLFAGDKRKRISLELTQEITEMTSLKTISGVGIRGSTVSMVRTTRRASRASPTQVLQALEGLTQLEKLRICILGKLEETDRELLISAIEQLDSSLKVLAMDDGFTGFLEQSNSFLTAAPPLLRTVELCGKLSLVPRWILGLNYLEKLSLPLTSLSTTDLYTLSRQGNLLSLTLSQHEDTQESQGEIVVPEMGFHCLQLLRLVAPVVPSLRFVEGSMYMLQKLEMKFRTSDGVHGLENLSSLKQVVLAVSSRAPSLSTADEIKRLAKNIPGKPPAVIVERYHESPIDK